MKWQLRLAFSTTICGLTQSDINININIDVDYFQCFIITWLPLKKHLIAYHPLSIFFFIVLMSFEYKLERSAQIIRSMYLYFWI